MPSPAPVNDLTRTARAPEVAKEAELDEEPLALLKPDHSVLQYVELLLAEEEDDYCAPAMMMLGFALGRREAVWWALQCVKKVPATHDKPLEKEALAATEKWFADFHDESRRKAFDLAEILDMDGPAALVATAAFFCEGSIGPANLNQEVPADKKAVHALSGSAVAVAAVLEPEKAKETCKAFLALAVEVAEGKNRWPDEKAPAPRAVQSTPTATRMPSPSPGSYPPIRPPETPKKKPGGGY